jgi:Mg-chelatase subunit ChlD
MRVTDVKRNENLTTITVQTTNKPRIFNVFILDASGSMGGKYPGSRYATALEGINELLVNIKRDTDSVNHTMIVEFEERNIVTTLPLTQTPPEAYAGMGTGGGTPLNEAVGETLEKIVEIRAKDFDVNDKILINVFTDGGENYSKGKYADKRFLGEYIKALEAQGVTVTFMGTQTEVNYAINHLNLKSSNTLAHDNTSRGIKMSFDRTVKARQAYSKSVAMGQDVTESFYTKSVDDTDNTNK